MDVARDESKRVGEAPTSERTRVVYTHAPLQLARLVAHSDQGWRIEVAGAESHVLAAPDVDPALLDEVLARGGRVLVESTSQGETKIAGVMQTRRAVEIDPDGHVSAKVRSFTVEASGEVLLKTTAAFLRVQAKNVELYGGEVLTRARDAARILGRLITLN